MTRYGTSVKNENNQKLIITNYYNNEKINFNTAYFPEPDFL